VVARRQSLIEFVKLCVSHRRYTSIWMLVKAIQRHMFSRQEPGIHKALNDNLETSVFGVEHDDCYRGRTRFDCEMLRWRSDELLQIFEAHSSQSLAPLLDNSSEFRKRLRKCAHASSLFYFPGMSVKASPSG
jgi:hypothetical protein